MVTKSRPLRSFKIKLPDPLQAARTMADNIRKNPDAILNQGLTRVLAEQRALDRNSVIAGVTAFHKEAMSRVPDLRRYPEAGPWAENILALQRELQRITGLSDQQMAIMFSLNQYMTFRGHREVGAALRKAYAREKCRIAFLPNTDQGPMHIKNVDDPINWWKPRPRMPRTATGWKQHPLSADGVGSGLHMDDEPADIFPLPVMQMLPHYAGDTPAALEFLKRYSPFWGGANILLFDNKFRSAAVEKCSRNFFESFAPNIHGHSHVSGMACRDPASPQGRYQKAQRNNYCKLFGFAEDAPDPLFWAACSGMEKMLDDALIRFGARPRAEDVMLLFTTQYPVGLNKAGVKLHPRQALAAYTLITHASLFKKRRSYRWQRSRDGKRWPQKPEICQFK